MKMLLILLLLVAPLGHADTYENNCKIYSLNAQLAGSLWQAYEKPEAAKKAIDDYVSSGAFSPDITDHMYKIVNKFYRLEADDGGFMSAIRKDTLRFNLLMTQLGEEYLNDCLNNKPQ